MQFVINERKFVEVDSQKYQGLVTPRAFQDYVYSDRKQPKAKHFEESLKNSFPTLVGRVEFLNKFYQCLLGDKMPHKVRKILCSGGKDSGKTTWAAILKGLFTHTFICCKCYFATNFLFSSSLFRGLFHNNQVVATADVFNTTPVGGQ